MISYNRKSPQLKPKTREETKRVLGIFNHVQQVGCVLPEGMGNRTMRLLCEIGIGTSTKIPVQFDGSP